MMMMIIIIIIIIITKPQLKSYLQSTCCYKKSNQFIKTLSTIPSLQNKTILYIISEEGENYSFTNSKK